MPVLRVRWGESMHILLVDYALPIPQLRQVGMERLHSLWLQLNIQAKSPQNLDFWKNLEKSCKNIWQKLKHLVFLQRKIKYKPTKYYYNGE